MTESWGRFRLVPNRDWQVIVVLVVVSVLVRLPFLRVFDLVSFDGTGYIIQAKALWKSVPQPGAFPLGYPFFISLLLPLMDSVRAAQVVSFTFAMGSLVVFFALARHYVERGPAFLATLVLTTGEGRVAARRSQEV